MNRSSVNFVVDVVAFSGFVFLTATGVLVRYVLPPGSGHFSKIWGLDRHEWGAVHFWIAIVLLSTLAVHLILHWRWVVSVIKGRPREGSAVRVWLAIVGIVALIALAVAPFLSNREQTGVPSHKLRTEKTELEKHMEIRGSMTLYEVEQLTGVSVENILRKLNLPSDIPADQQLGKLRRKYGFEMDDVRKIVQP